MGCLNPIFCVSCRHRKTGPRPASHVRPFTDRFHRLIRPLLTSAVPSRRLSTPVAHRPTRTGQNDRPPRVRHATFASSTCRIYAVALRMTSGFGSHCPLARVTSPLCASCSSGRSFAYTFLQTPPRDDALDVQLAVPVIRARRGLPPPSRPARHHSGPDSASHGATRHAWHTKTRNPGIPRGFPQTKRDDYSLPFRCWIIMKVS